MSARGVEDVYTLAPMQQGMLVESLLAPRAGVYVQQLSCTLAGPLDVPALLDAWRGVWARHPVLRTSFAWEGVDEPHQIVHRTADLPVEQLDWRALDPRAQETTLERWLREDRRRGFDLARPPLARLLLARLGADLVALVWTFHHLLLDNWTETTLLEELATTHRALAQREAPRLPPVRPFRDYVAAVRGRDPGPARAFWRRAMAGVHAPNQVRGDRGPAGARREDEGLAERTRPLSARTTGALRALARRHRVTAHVVVQGAWALALARASASAEVVFGTTVRVRGAEALAAGATALGPLINTLPLRVRIDDERPLGAWLGTLQAAGVAAREHDHVSLAQIQAWSDLPRGMPLFETFVVAQAYDVGAPLRTLAPGVAVGRLRYVQQSNLPLMLTEVAGTPAAVRLTWDPRRIPDVVAGALLDACASLLDAFAADPEARLGRLRERLDREAACRLAAGLAPSAAADRAALRTVRRRGVAVAPGTEPR